MENLDFSYNWNNKLSGNYFTTLRLNTSKYQKGKTLQIRLKHKELEKAQIMETRILQLEDINEWIAGIDTGYTAEQTKGILRKMYPSVDWKTQKLIFVLLKKIKN